MQKLIVDTNVFISSIIQPSYPYLISKELFSGNLIQLCISSEIWDEYLEVLNRDKFSRYPEFLAKAQLLLASISNKAIRYTPSVKLSLIKDVDDNKFLELAETCNADFLITGNTHDFTMRNYKGTQIVTPKEYWENYKPK
jgi:putative PIN family toxin of toxin-antitoxin system